MTTDTAQLQAEEQTQEAAGENLWRSAWRTLRHHPTGMIGLVGFVLVLLVVILAPLLAPTDPTEMDFDHLLEPPSALHPFGTDDLGRDILSRVLWGGRESLRVALIGLAIAGLGGIVFGLVSGYYGGLVDSSIMRIVDIFLAFPFILLVLSIVAALGPNLGTVLIALGISSIPGVARYVRGSVLAAKNCEYIMAAEVLGASDSYIMFTQILPNIMAPLIIYSTLGLGGLIMATAGLSYIGLGLPARRLVDVGLSRSGHLCRCTLYQSPGRWAAGRSRPQVAGLARRHLLCQPYWNSET